MRRSKPAVTRETLKLAEAKLGSSGLTLDDARLLGIEFSDAATIFDKSWPKVPALRLVYHTLDGQPRKDTCRVRVLAQPKGAFGEVDTHLRYLQPTNTPPAAYFPTTVPWVTIAPDATKLLLITEGELKAACAAKLGYPCIGLGGVSSWRSAKLGWSLLPELVGFAWQRRDVVIIYDSDAASNPDVAAATSALCQELSNRGALPRVAVLPEVAGLGKTGLDDLVVAQGPEALEAVIEAAGGDELSRKLWEFNGSFVYVFDPGAVYNTVAQKLIKSEVFRVAQGNVWATAQVLQSDGTMKMKDTQVANAWLQWPLRRQLAGLTYDPGESLERPAHDGLRLNTWPGWGVEAAKGDVKLWTQLLDHLFDGAETEARDWFEHWCLYPLKHPGAKLPTAAGVWSKEQGLGKSLVGKLLGRVYGLNYAEVSQKELESNFNGWHVYKQLVMFDDVSAYDSRAKADVLKKMISEETVVVNIKGIPTFEVPDHANFYLTSNKLNAFYLEDDDRRFFVHEIRSPKLPAKFFRDFHKWMGRCKEFPALGPGPAALLHHARHGHDFAGFEPYAPPPMTSAKREMTEAVKGEVELWLAELRREPEAKLKAGAVPLARDLWSPRELLELFEPSRKGPPVAVSTFGIRMREVFSPANRGQTLKPSGSSERFYVIRNDAKWLKATRQQLETHVKVCRAQEQGASAGRY